MDTNGTNDNYATIGIIVIKTATIVLTHLQNLQWQYDYKLDTNNTTDESKMLTIPPMMM